MPQEPEAPAPTLSVTGCTVTVSNERLPEAVVALANAAKSNAEAIAEIAKAIGAGPPIYGMYFENQSADRRFNLDA